MKFIDPEEIKENNEEDKESQPAEVHKEEAEPGTPEIDDAQIRALALAYARYLKEHDLAPGDATYVEPEEIGVSDDFDIEFDFDLEDDETPEESEEELEKELFGEEEVPEEFEEPVEEILEELPVEEPIDEEPEEVEETAEELPTEESEDSLEEIPEEIVEKFEPVEAIEEEPAEEAPEEVEEIAEELPTEESEDASEEISEEIVEKYESVETIEEESVEEEPEEVSEEPIEEVIEELPAEEPTEENESIEEEAPEADEASDEESEAVPEVIPEETVEEIEQAEEAIEEPAGEETSEEAPAEVPEEKKEKEEDPKKKAAREAKERAAREKIRKRIEAKEKKKEKFLKGGSNPIASVTNLHDKVQDGIDGAFVTVGKQFITGAHRISSTYIQSRKFIGIAVLVTGLLAAGLLIVFDMFTVYEYAYNGKVLGYVKNQEEVTDVLDVAGRQLTYNSSTEADVKFVANENVTFNPVDGRGKSTDDSDTVVNKLIYMTDIETEAYAVFDGDKVVAVVKDQNDADNLLLQTKEDLSIPDKGMELISAEFINELSVKPVNVLLGSIQSNAAAQEQMTNGGEMNIYHIIEEGETIKGIADEFGVEDFEIYNEDNSEPVSEIETGDRVCIRCLVSPVGVEMVEKGKIKEIIEFETIKKESDEYYKGDSFLKQEGQDGVELFEGYITKVSGEETERKPTAKVKTLKKKKDKIIVVGTAERPKTAATGTFIVPLDSYVITSEWGGRWGRLHEGMDLAAPTGTPIHASDGGKIIKANYWSGHGLCVEIDHGNGIVTRYSHCSAVFVSIGDLVYQGQHIANVGNTGHSFGSHCHFEVRVNDVSQNPRNYINP